MSFPWADVPARTWAKARRIRKVTLRSRFVVAVFIIVVAWAGPAFAQHAPYYVLDAFGGVHAAGGAPAISPATPYFGFDVAATIEYVAVGTSTATGDGVIVLDKWGGVHYGGALATHPPGGPPTPYFGFDASRGLALRDIPTRMASASDTATMDFTTTATSYTTMTSLTIYAPASGFLHVIGNANVNCPSGAGANSAGYVVVNVDSTSAGTLEGLGLSVIAECGNAPGAGYPTDNQTVSNVFAVGPGQHTVYLLGRKAAGTGTFRVVNRTLTAQFVAADGQGQVSIPTPQVASPPPSDPSATGLSIGR